MNMLDINEDERRILKALAYMALQYLSSREGELDDMCMGAGQRALTVLADYGLITLHEKGRYGWWTKAGHDLMNEP